MESLHQVHAAIVNARGELIAKVGNPDFTTYFRSSAKPFQTLALFRSGVIDHFNFDDHEIAIITSSHNGEEIHVQAVYSLLDKIGADESQLQCGFHPPLYPPAAAKLYADRKPSSPVYNNCSGKHTGMLAACRMHKYDIAAYLLPQHPHQQLIRQIISEFSEQEIDDKHVAIDGCGAPVFYLSLRQMAKMYSAIASSSAPDIVRIRNAMCQNPEYVGGTDRFDTVFMQQMQGKAIAKAGGEALESIAFFAPEPVGIVVKSQDGQKRGLESAAVEILRQLGLISEEDCEKLKLFWKPVLKNHTGTPIGEIELNLKVENQ